MDKFFIEYKEIGTAYFAVEADNEEEALARFEEWRLNADDVYSTISNADITSDVSIIDESELWGGVDDGDTLTDEDYHNLF